MEASSLAALDGANLGTDTNVGRSRQTCRSFSSVMRVARGLWRSKVPEELASITGRSVRTCERWLCGDVDPDGEATLALLLSKHGSKLYAAKIAELPLNRQIEVWKELRQASKRHLLLLERRALDAQIAAMGDDD